MYGSNTMISMFHHTNRLSRAGNQNLHEIARLDSSHHLSDTVSKLVELPVSANKKAGLMTSDQPQVFEMKTRTLLTNTTVEWTTPCFGFVANFISVLSFETNQHCSILHILSIKNFSKMSY